MPSDSGDGFEGSGPPSGWQPEHIPGGNELVRAATRAVAEETAFVLLHQEDPQAIADRLDHIIDVVRMGTNIKGPQRKQAIQLGLNLQRNVWHMANRVAEWSRFIILLHNAARELDDMELMVGCFRRWSNVAALDMNADGFRVAIEGALDYARSTGDPHWEMIVRLEELSFARLTADHVLVLEEAEELLARARALNFTYGQGRIYLLLADLYHARGRHAEAFRTAQQAYLIQSQVGCWITTAHALLYMVSALQATPRHSRVYVRVLMQELERLAVRLNDPWLLIGFWHSAGVREYHAGNHDTARRYMLQAAVSARRLGWNRSEAAMRRVLGLIQIERHCWTVAQRHLNRARVLYTQAGDDVGRWHSEYTAVYISFAKNDMVRAEHDLSAFRLRVLASNLPPQEKAHLLRLIDDDLKQIRGQSSGGSGGRGGD